MATPHTKVKSQYLRACLLREDDKGDSGKLSLRDRVPVVPCTSVARLRSELAISCVLQSASTSPPVRLPPRPLSSHTRPPCPLLSADATASSTWTDSGGSRGRAVGERKPSFATA